MGVKNSNALKLLHLRAWNQLNDLFSAIQKYENSSFTQGTAIHLCLQSELGKKDKSYWPVYEAQWEISARFSTESCEMELLLVVRKALWYFAFALNYTKDADEQALHYLLQTMTFCTIKNSLCHTGIFSYFQLKKFATIVATCRCSDTSLHGMHRKWMWYSTLKVCTVLVGFWAANVLVFLSPLSMIFCSSCYKRRRWLHQRNIMPWPARLLHVTFGLTTPYFEQRLVMWSRVHIL